MSIEIERKFLLRNDGWRAHALSRRRICQGYLGSDSGFSIRVRIVDDAEATLTVKSGNAGLKRLEYGYPIPLADAVEMLAMRQGSCIVKLRHLVPWHGATWEIDVFEGDNAGLTLAEIELRDDTERPVLPPWAGAEVTGDPRYYNNCLVRHPFRLWRGDRIGPQGTGQERRLIA
jgi:adenylate cyclase